MPKSRPLTRPSSASKCYSRSDFELGRMDLLIRKARHCHLITASCKERKSWHLR